MDTKKVKELLQHYFNAESTLAEERLLTSYFQSGNVAEDLKEYSGLFTGISELAETGRHDKLEDELMAFIREADRIEKQKTRKLWVYITGIAAAVVIAIGGVLFYQQQNSGIKDTFDNPQVAYNYAEQTLGYVASKYNKGLSALASFEKLETAAQPLQKGVRPLNQYLRIIDEMKNE